MSLSQPFLIAIFVPWACALALAHVAKRDFRAYLRRRHAAIYQRVYGVHADRTRYSALNPLVWALQFRFEISRACEVLADRHLTRLGRRLRRALVLTIALYFAALAAVVAHAHAAQPGVGTVGSAEMRS
jgi:hypothetical protein